MMDNGAKFNYKNWITNIDINHLKSEYLVNGYINNYVISNSVKYEANKERTHYFEERVSYDYNIGFYKDKIINGEIIRITISPCELKDSSVVLVTKPFWARNYITGKMFFVVLLYIEQIATPDLHFYPLDKETKVTIIDDSNMFGHSSGVSIYECTIEIDETKHLIIKKNY